ncbi:MAG: hypothetical protein ACUVTG_15965, partial [Candidatus Oleimicrobiaceae bacterium]
RDAKSQTSWSDDPHSFGSTDILNHGNHSKPFRKTFFSRKIFKSQELTRPSTTKNLPVLNFKRENRKGEEHQ